MEKKMKTTLGFLSEKKTITEFVNDFFDNICDVGLEAFPSSFDIKEMLDIKNYAKLCYAEANSLSHANGYMIKSNTGAFTDYFYVILVIDVCIINILLKMYTAIVNFSKVNSKNYNKLIYDMNKRIKKYHKLMLSKCELDLMMNPFKVRKM